MVSYNSIINNVQSNYVIIYLNISKFVKKKFHMVTDKIILTSPVVRYYLVTFVDFRWYSLYFFKCAISPTVSLHEQMRLLLSAASISRVITISASETKIKLQHNIQANI